eukprot:COSAG05_NODE_39_length_27555_cov_750.282925_11_plen_87_part_00
MASKATRTAWLLLCVLFAAWCVTIVVAQDKEKIKEEDLPQEFHETGAKTGLGAVGYFKALLENCHEKKIQGACDVLQTHGVHDKEL